MYRVYSTYMHSYINIAKIDMDICGCCWIVALEISKRVCLNLLIVDGFSSVAVDIAYIVEIDMKIVPVLVDHFIVCVCGGGGGGGGVGGGGSPNITASR